MRKNCYDPVCPANNQFASTSKSTKSKTKKRKTACHRPCPSTSRSSTKPRRKRSKYARSKKRSKERVKTSEFKFCKNKKCQASRLNAESSTSIHPSEKICVRSKESVKLCRSRLPCQDSRPGKRTICNCQPRRNVAIKKTKEKKPCRFAKYRRQTKRLMPHCICVRTSSAESFRRTDHPSCPILSKYDDCCCIRHRRRGSNRKTTASVAQRDLENGRPSCKCRSKPPPVAQQNVFQRGLSFFGKKIQKFKRPFSNDPVPNRPRVRRSCPVEGCCSRSALKRRNYSSPERRKVKFCK